MTSPDASFDRLTVFGADWCRDCIRSTSLLDRLGADYAYIDLVAHPEEADRAQQISGRTNIPVIVFPDGRHLVEPTDPELEAALRS